MSGWPNWLRHLTFTEKIAGSNPALDNLVLAAKAEGE